MKRKYETPYLGLESFQLNAAIAQSCSGSGFQSINQSENSCTFDGGQFYNFFNCQVDLTDSTFDNHDSICYHGPIASGGVVFTCS